MQFPTADLYTAATWQDVIRALLGRLFDVQFRHRSNPPMRVRTKLILPKSMQPPARIDSTMCGRCVAQVRLGGIDRLMEDYLGGGLLYWSTER